MRRSREKFKMSSHAQQEKQREHAKQALEDVVAGKARLCADGVWRSVETDKATPWNREAKRLWKSQEALLMEHHQNRLHALEDAERSAAHQLGWYRDRVCEGCSELHCDGKGKPFLNDAGQPRTKHEFHISSAEWAELEQNHKEATEALLAAYEERDAFVLGMKLAPPRDLYEAFDQDQRTGVGVSLAKIAAGDLTFSGGVFSVELLRKRLDELERSIGRDEAILAGKELDHGLLSRSERAEGLERNRPNLAFGRWLLATHASLLVVR